MSKRDLKPSVISFSENLHATLDSQLMNYFSVVVGRRRVGSGRSVKSKVRFVKRINLKLRGARDCVD